jgi:ABC-2 type transport system ATP-binding protein
MEPAVTVVEVTKTLGDHRAVDGASLEVQRGHLFGLLGPNGAGKTTTIRMIMDILRPDSGTIQVLGRAPGDGAKERVGYLPEERGLYRKMKVLDMLEFQGSIRGARPSDARREAAAWLDRLEIGDWKDKKVEELSKGMQQKVQFVASVLGSPEMLILDEPFSGMDPVNQNLFKDVLVELNRAGTTIVFSTHQMDTAERLCHEIALLHRGKVVLSGPLAQVKERFGSNSILLEFDGDGAFLKTLTGVARVDDYGNYQEVRLEAGADPQAILRCAAGALRIRRFELVAPTLHSIFLEQVGRETADA